jgi:hypothetical protein
VNGDGEGVCAPVKTERPHPPATGVKIESGTDVTCANVQTVDGGEGNIKTELVCQHIPEPFGVESDDRRRRRVRSANRNRNALPFVKAEANAAILEESRQINLRNHAAGMLLKSVGQPHTSDPSVKSEAAPPKKRRKKLEKAALGCEQPAKPQDRKHLVVGAEGQRVLSQILCRACGSDDPTSWSASKEVTHEIIKHDYFARQNCSVTQAVYAVCKYKDAMTCEQPAKPRLAVGAAHTPTFTDACLEERLQEYNAGVSSSGRTSPTPMATNDELGTSSRGGHVVRLRTISVEGCEIPQPQNGSWYQTSEAVRILYELKEKGGKDKRLGKKVVEVWRSKTPPWIDMSYESLSEKRRRIEKAVSSQGCTVDQAIQELIRDRVAVDQPAASGPAFYMSKDRFIAALWDSNRQEEAAPKARAAIVLAQAKAAAYAKRGLQAPKAAVAQKTVDAYWEHVGGKANPR